MNCIIRGNCFARILGVVALSASLAGSIRAWNLNVTGPISPIYFGQLNTGSELEGVTSGSTSTSSGPYLGDQYFEYNGSYSVEEVYGVFGYGGWGYESRWSYSAAFDVPNKDLRVYIGNGFQHLEESSFGTEMVGWTLTFP